MSVRSSNGDVHRHDEALIGGLADERALRPAWDTSGNGNGHTDARVADLADERARRPGRDSAAGGRGYADPYLAGACLGLVLLAAFVITGRGLGASGAFATTAAGLTHAIAPAQADANPYFARYLVGDGPWRDWLLVEIAGVALGGALSAWLAGRLRGEIERGPRAGRSQRLALAFGGGLVMGLGAVLARGCTSGLALTGGALLGVGAWLFMFAAFAGAYLAAPLLRRVWR